jgi:hypothetical protein
MLHFMPSRNCRTDILIPGAGLGGVAAALGP